MRRITLNEIRMNRIVNDAVNAIKRGAINEAMTNVQNGTQMGVTPQQPVQQQPNMAMQQINNGVQNTMQNMPLNMNTGNAEKLTQFANTQLQRLGKLDNILKRCGC